MRYKIFMGVFLWISALILHAQKVDKAKLLAIYDRQFEFLDSLLKQPFIDPCVALRDFEANSPLHSRGDDITPGGRETFFPENQGDLDWYALFEEAVNQKMHANILAVKNQTGLQWSSSYYNRTVPYKLYQFIDEDGDFSMVKDRFQTDLSWDLMHCGLLWGKSRIAAHKIEAALTLVDARMNIQNSYVERLSAENVQRYQKALAFLRALRLQNLSLLEQTETVLLENHQSSTDQLLKVTDELFMIEQIQTTDNRLFQSLSGLAYQAIDTVALHTDLFLEAVKSQNNELRKLDLGYNRINAQMEQTSFWSSISLSPFIRFGFYNMVGNQRQGSIDMGVNLRIPLSFEQRKIRKALAAEQQILTIKRDLSYHVFQEEVSSLIQELSQINKRMIYEYHCIQRMRDLLLGRSEAFKTLYGEYSRPDRIREYNRYIVCLESIVQLKYQRNAILIGLQRYLSHERIDSYIDYIKQG